jgi:hypothetical protein
MFKTRKDIDEATRPEYKGERNSTINSLWAAERVNKVS